MGVDRSKKGAGSTQAIVDRAVMVDTFPLIVFAEGTCTTGNQPPVACTASVCRALSGYMRMVRQRSIVHSLVTHTSHMAAPTPMPGEGSQTEAACFVPTSVPRQPTDSDALRRLRPKAAGVQPTPLSERCSPPSAPCPSSALPTPPPLCVAPPHCTPHAQDHVSTAALQCVEPIGLCTKPLHKTISAKNLCTKPLHKKSAQSLCTKHLHKTSAQTQPSVPRRCCLAACGTSAAPG